MATVESKDFLKLNVAEFINQLSDMKTLKFMSKSGDNYRVVNDYIKDFVESANLENTQYLGFISCGIVDEVVKALLAKSHTLNKLTHLTMPWNNLSVEGIEALARLEYEKTGKLELGTTIRYSSDVCKIFYDFLKEEYSKNQSFDIPDENKNSVKKMIFDVARMDNNGDSVKYILEQPEKYPFLINSKDEQGHTLLHSYAHSPRMQEFLFKHGLIPEKKPEENNESRNISQNRQSVHSGSVSKRTRLLLRD